MIDGLLIGAAIVYGSIKIADAMQGETKPKKKKVKGTIIEPTDKADIDQLINELNGN